MYHVTKIVVSYNSYTEMIIKREKELGELVTTDRVHICSFFSRPRMKTTQLNVSNSVRAEPIIIRVELNTVWCTVIVANETG